MIKAEMTFAHASADRSRTVRDFARSELFDRTFREGMELVEETPPIWTGRDVAIPRCCRAPPLWPMRPRA